MKITGFIFVVSLFISAACSKQKPIDPPSSVVAALEARFGKVSGTVWELSGDTVYVALFNPSKNPVRAYFGLNGQWHKTETEFLSSELPSIVISTVHGSFPGNSIAHALRIEEIDKETFFRLSLKRGNAVTDVDLSLGGVILK